MARHRKTWKYWVFFVVAALMTSLAACGGGGPGSANVSGASVGSSSSTLSGGTDINGKTILFEIKSGPSNFFFVPAVNGAKAAAAIAGVKLQIQYGNDDDA